MHWNSLRYTIGFPPEIWYDIADEESVMLRDAFAPVGLMIDYWIEKTGDAGKREDIKVYVINDFEEEWKGKVTFHIKSDGKVLWDEAQRCKIDGWGREILTFSVTLPSEKGHYKLVAELKGVDGEVVQSIRKLQMID